MIEGDIIFALGTINIIKIGKFGKTKGTLGMTADKFSKGIILRIKGNLLAGGFIMRDHILRARMRELILLSIVWREIMGEDCSQQ